MTSLDQVAATAIRDGWVSLNADIRTLAKEAVELGWTMVPIRRGDSPLGTLRVVDAADAHPHSLSAMVGAGQQPLHTDGAHHKAMPDLVLLSAVAPTSTPTLLCVPESPTEAQRTGVFKVGGGRTGFYSGVVDRAGRWRYDPGCMAPMDDEARAAAVELAALAESAIAHNWTEPNTVLAIANRRLLHARAAAGDAPTRQVDRVALITGMDS